VIQKIISSGQSGVGRGALNAATALDIPYAGWTPTGHFMNGEPLPEPYHLEEMLKVEEATYIEENVTASDGTLIIINGVLSGESVIARKKTMVSDKPFVLIDLGKMGSFQASQSIHEWLGTHGVTALYVVGATANESRKLEQATQNLIEATYYLDLIENNMTAPAKLHHYHDTMDAPSSIDNAVSQTISKMPLKDRVTMANLTESELIGLQQTLGEYIRRKLPLWRENQAFIASFRETENAKLEEDALIISIIRQIWEALRDTHKMRIIK
jgi:putative molybdenum carrier protein